MQDKKSTKIAHELDPAMCPKIWDCAPFRDGVVQGFTPIIGNYLTRELTAHDCNKMVAEIKRLKSMLAISGQE